MFGSNKKILEDVTWSERRSKKDKIKLSAAIKKIRAGEAIDVSEVCLSKDGYTELVPFEIHKELVALDPTIEEEKQKIIEEFGFQEKEK